MHTSTFFSFLASFIVLTGATPRTMAKTRPTNDIKWHMQFKKMYKNSTKKANSCALHPNLRSSYPFQLENTLRLHCVILKWSNKAKKKIMRIRWESVVKTHYVLPARENAYHKLVIDFHFGSNWWRGWRAQNVKTNKKARLGYIWLVDKREQVF